MGGGLMQLVAYGAQDVYLTGNPQITFFKVVYRRHTNFSMEAISQTFNGTAALGNKVTATISRNGDLIHRMYVQCTLTEGLDNTPAPLGLVNNVGHRILENVELEIGGQRIDKHYSQWLDIWSELSVSNGKEAGYNLMVDAGTGNTHYVPLQFWFCRNPGLALPLIALQYHEVKVNIQFAQSANCISIPNAVTVGVPASMTNATLWVDYIYLDTDERRRFAQVSHEYLIEQLQHTGVESTSSNAHRLNFNHPIKELVWVNSATDEPTWNTWAPVNNCKLQLNGHDRFTERDGSYFSLVQPHQHHTNIPVTNINVYSFAIKPEDHQPSGTCNMSRIDNATLNIAATDGNVLIYAVNYNVLRIMGGMGGLAYSN
jgi:hypothetical protein